MHRQWLKVSGRDTVCETEEGKEGEGRKDNKGKTRTGNERKEKGEKAAGKGGRNTFFLFFIFWSLSHHCRYAVTCVFFFVCVIV